MTFRDHLCFLMTHTKSSNANILFADVSWEGISDYYKVYENFGEFKFIIGFVLCSIFLCSCAKKVLILK